MSEELPEKPIQTLLFRFANYLVEGIGYAIKALPILIVYLFAEDDIEIVLEVLVDNENIQEQLFQSLSDAVLESVSGWIIGILIISVVANILLIGAFFIQNKTKKKYVKKAGKLESKKMEAVDPDRQSSNITPTGETNPEDK